MRKLFNNVLGRMPDEEFEFLVGTSSSISDILNQLGYVTRPQGRAPNIIRERIRALKLDTSHFDSTSRGHTPLPPESVLTSNSRYRSNQAKRAYRSFKSLRYEYKECGQKPLWCGKPLVLVFDHINGNNRDHRPSNLRWLCPNCNSQTSTFAGRNKRNPLKSGVR